MRFHWIALNLYWETVHGLSQSLLQNGKLVIPLQFYYNMLVNYNPSSWSWVVLVKMVVTQLVHNSPPLEWILRHCNSVHTLTLHLRSISIISSHLHLSTPTMLFPFTLPTFTFHYIFLFQLIIKGYQLHPVWLINVLFPLSFYNITSVTYQDEPN